MTEEKDGGCGRKSGKEGRRRVKKEKKPKEWSQLEIGGDKNQLYNGFF